ncbi:hypothetical protein B0H14DRAFT_3529573 [Mycena olivaceomarginata]|nr:hypothetical protein B0H14DRAFT_3529573 [Mycena olivaceomarginata]
MSSAVIRAYPRASQRAPEYRQTLTFWSQTSHLQSCRVCLGPSRMGYTIIIGLICASAVIMVIFWFYEVWRENNVKSVFVPPSIWKHPSARMPAMIAAVSFCLVQLQHSLYLCALYYQQINGLSPLQTSIRLLPAIGAGMTINLAGERLLSRVSGLAMILGTLTLNMVSSKSRILFLDVNSNGLLSGFTLCASSRPEFDEIPFEF